MFNFSLSFFNDKERGKKKNLDQKKMLFWDILKRDFEDVWTKRSMSEPLAKFREFDLENHVKQKLVKILIK